MKEIKFRVFLKDRKEMVEVYEMVFTRSGISVRLMGFNPAHYRTFKFNEFEIMQLTGLKDKNGKEIYEGDLIRSLVYNAKAVFTVVWETPQFVVRLGTIKAPLDPQYLEVIGNIHENLELLKEKP